MSAPFRTLVTTMLNENEMLGKVQSQHSNDALLIVSKEDGQYAVEFEGPGNGKRFADILHLCGNECGMKDGSYMDFGGGREKRVTITETSTGDTYAYVRVGVGR